MYIPPLLYSPPLAWQYLKEVPQSEREVLGPLRLRLEPFLSYSERSNEYRTSYT
jgi:hypothetical protein